MSVHTRKLHTNAASIEVIIQDRTRKTFLIPRSASSKLLGFLKSLEMDNDESIPADEAFKELDQKYGKIGVTIRGCRHRDGLTQVELAKKLNIAQGHVSQIEHSKRAVGKKLAQKLAKIFNTDYRLFL